MFQISQTGLIQVKFCVVKCLANIYIQVTVLIIVCCNSTFMLQGLILCPILIMMCLIMYLCVFGAIVEALLIKMSFLFRK